MLQNFYILSEGGWAIKSSEIFADIFFTLSLFVLYLFLLLNQTVVFGWVSLEILLLTCLYSFYLFKYKYPVYYFAIFSQTLLFFFLIPIPFLHPLLIFFSVTSAFVFHFLFSRFYDLRLNLVSYLLFFFFLWDAFLLLIGTPLRISAPTSLSFPIFQVVETNSLGPVFSFPWILKGELNPVNFRSSFEFLSTFVLMGISLAAFRRPILFSFLIGWILIFYLFGGISGALPLPWVISYASTAFLIHIAPGRNYYGSFYVSIICFFLLLPVAWFLGIFGGYPILVLLVFFPLEALLIRVFLGK